MYPGSIKSSVDEDLEEKRTNKSESTTQQRQNTLTCNNNN